MLRKYLNTSCYGKKLTLGGISEEMQLRIFRSLVRLLVITCTPSVLFYFTVIHKGVSAHSTPMVGTTSATTETEIVNTTKESTTVTTTPTPAPAPTPAPTEKPDFWSSFFGRITPAKLVGDLRMKPPVEERVIYFDGVFKDRSLSKTNINTLVHRFSYLSEPSLGGNNPELLWRLAKAYYHYADVNNDASYIDKGMQLIEYTFELDDEIAEAHKWYAKLVSWKAEEKHLSTQVSIGKTYKKHLDIALSLNDTDPTVNFMLGEYYYRLCEVPQIQRYIARFVFNIPPGTFDDAIKYLLRANELDSGLKHVKLFLAKTYLALNDRSSARKYLFQAVELIENDAFHDQKDEYHIDQSATDNEIKSLLNQF